MSIPTSIDEYQLSLFSSKKRWSGRTCRRRCVHVSYGFVVYTPSGLISLIRLPRKWSRQVKVMYPDIKQRQAYDDIKLLKVLIGNLEQESKEWHRHVFNQRTDMIYKAAMRAKDFRSAEKANADYAKYNKLNVDEPEPQNYSDIVPQMIIPTDDPSVIGIKPVKDLRGKIQRLKKKLGADIEDADFVEIKEDDQGEGEEKDLSE